MFLIGHIKGLAAVCFCFEKGGLGELVQFFPYRVCRDIKFFGQLGEI
jgi:hypothetical protein